MQWQAHLSRTYQQCVVAACTPIAQPVLNKYNNRFHSSTTISPRTYEQCVVAACICILQLSVPPLAEAHAVHVLVILHVTLQDLTQTLKITTKHISYNNVTVNSADTVKKKHE
jgi:hypothetical protein